MIDAEKAAAVDFDIVYCCTLEPDGKQQASEGDQLKEELSRDGQTFFDCEEEKAEEEVAALLKVCNFSSPDKEQSKLLCCCGYSWLQIKWSNVIWLLTLHSLFFFAFSHCLVSPVKMQSVFWTVFTSIFSGFGMAGEFFIPTWFIKITTFPFSWRPSSVRSPHLQSHTTASCLSPTSADDDHQWECFLLRP